MFESLFKKQLIGVIAAVFILIAVNVGRTVAENNFSAPISRQALSLEQKVGKDVSQIEQKIRTFKTERNRMKIFAEKLSKYKTPDFALSAPYESVSQKSFTYETVDFMRMEKTEMVNSASFLFFDSDGVFVESSQMLWVGDNEDPDLTQTANTWFGTTSKTSGRRVSPNVRQQSVPTNPIFGPQESKQTEKNDVSGEFTAYWIKKQ